MINHNLGWCNRDVELGPCAVIRQLRSVAFVWETKRPQADNSRSLIDRQVSCVDFSSILCLWFAIQGIRTYNFFYWVSNAATGCIFAIVVIFESQTISLQHASLLSIRLHSWAELGIPGRRSTFTYFTFYISQICYSLDWISISYWSNFHQIKLMVYFKPLITPVN